MTPSKFSLFFLAASVAIVSCSKKDDATDPPATPPGAEAKVQYNITATNRAGSLVQFTSATAASKQIAFKGVSSETTERYQLNFNTIDLFSPSAPIAFVMVPAGTYTNAQFNYQMTPTRNPALQLKGTYNGTPLTINLETFVEVATKLPTITLEGSKTYNANLELDLQAALNGITATQLDNATRTNGEIVIGSFSNTSLLQTVLNNINNVNQHKVTVN